MRKTRCSMLLFYFLCKENKNSVNLLLIFVRMFFTWSRYHTIHHTDKDSNFCLFMPLFDLLGGTLNDKSWELQKRNSAGKLQELE